MSTFVYEQGLSVMSKRTDELTEFVESHVARLTDAPNIWSQPPVAIEPEKWLASWQIYKAISSKYPMSNFGYHFVGFDVRVRHGAVSSKVEQFDPVKMQGITQSGRIYQLLGEPEVDPDAQYTLGGWSKQNQVVLQDATKEFIQHYQIDLEQIRKLSPASDGNLPFSL